MAKLPSDGLIGRICSTASVGRAHAPLLLAEWLVARRRHGRVADGCDNILIRRTNTLVRKPRAER
jgi:hypothetical protein